MTQATAYQRITEIDFLRGVALFGILLVNVTLFSYSPANYESWLKIHSTRTDQTIIKLGALLVEQRFVGIFSFLFGWGIAIQKDRFADRKIAFIRHYLQRSLKLAIFGTLNICLFFWGDILLIYAMLSIIILPMLNLSNKTLMIMAAVIFTVPTILLLFPFMIDSFHAYEQGLSRLYDQTAINAIHSSGSFWPRMLLRVQEYRFYNLANILWQRTALACMLLGYTVGRNKYQFNLLTETRKFRIPVILCFLYSLGFLLYSFIGKQNLFGPVVYYLFDNLFIPVSIFLYIALLLVLHRLPLLKRFNALVSLMGRLSLSNYFLQSILCSMIFSGALYYKTTPTENIIIAVCVYLLQMLASTVYLKKIKTGPLEYLLRR